jgi:penicillin V acylase-like amidase (Ntn superfamily)
MGTPPSPQSRPCFLDGQASDGKVQRSNAKEAAQIVLLGADDQHIFPAMRRLLIILSLFCNFPAFSCTTFVLGGGRHAYLGKNLDWDWDEGFLLVNPRNIQKRAFVSAENAAQWTSKYGSVTFNQFGREMPFGGMNEAGLVVENMWLDDTKYPATDSRPEINMLQWIQYQLDNCRTVNEVIATDKKIRLENTPVRARIHYLVCDTRGDSATIEFLNGTMQVHRGRDLRYQALANDTYERSRAAFRANSSLGDLSKPMPDKDSITRFCRAAARAKSFKSGKSSAQDVAYAFETLEQVRQGNYTAWQVVYDLSARQIHFRTRSNTQNRRVDLKPLNFACNRPIQFADIQSNSSSSGALEFHDFIEGDHRKFLNRFYAQDSLKQTVGDVGSMIEPLLFTLRSYKCADR